MLDLGSAESKKLGQAKNGKHGNEPDEAPGMADDDFSLLTTGSALHRSATLDA